MTHRDGDGGQDKGRRGGGGGGYWATHRSAIGCRRILDNVVDDMWRSGGAEQRKPEAGMLLAAAQHHLQFLGHVGVPSFWRSCCSLFQGSASVSPFACGSFFRSCASLFVINSRFGLGQRNSTPLHLHSDTRRRTLTLHTHNTRRHTRRTHALTDYSLKLTPFRICLNIIALALYFAFFSRFFSSTQTCLIFFHLSQSLLFGSVSFLALFAAVRGSRGRGKGAQPHILGRPWVPAIAADIAVQLFCHKSR